MTSSSTTAIYKTREAIASEAGHTRGRAGRQQARMRPLAPRHLSSCVRRWPVLSTCSSVPLSTAPTALEGSAMTFEADVRATIEGPG